MPKLNEADFADMFGADLSSFDQQFLDAVVKADFRYEYLNHKQEEQLIIEVLDRLFDDSQKVGEANRKLIWDRGWAENLEAFLKSGGNPETLTPKFIRQNQAMRFRQRYIVSLNPNFELDFVGILRKWLFKEFFSEHEIIYEFGCGTGFNLLAINNFFPQKKLIGLDFVPSSVNLVKEIAVYHNIDLTGYLFDFTNPDYSLDLASESAVFTFGALEQVAGQFEEFLAYLLNKKPALVVHVEPTAELYDPYKLIDKLAILFHKKRGYTQGLLPRLQQLACEKNIELIKTKRTGFGSLMMEGYTIIAWRPL